MTVRKAEMMRRFRFCNGSLIAESALPATDFKVLLYLPSVLSMTQNRLPTSSIFNLQSPLWRIPPFLSMRQYWQCCRRWGDEYQPGATSGRPASPAVGKAVIIWRRPSTAATTVDLLPVTVQQTGTAAGNCTGASGVLSRSVHFHKYNAKWGEQYEHCSI